MQPVRSLAMGKFAGAFRRKAGKNIDTKTVKSGRGGYDILYSLYGELEQLVMRGEKHRRVLSRKIICLASTAPPLSLSFSLSIAWKWLAKSRGIYDIYTGRGCASIDTAKGG